MPSEKTLKRIVIILGALIVILFAVVVGTIIIRAIGGDNEGGGQPATGVAFTIPDGATILGGSRSGETIMYHFETADGVEMVVVVDAETGAVIGELEVEPC